MNLEHDILFAKIFERPTILVCGQEEKVDGYALKKLLHVFNDKGRAIQHVFFSYAEIASRNFLKSTPLAEGQEYLFEANDAFIRKALQTPLSRGFNLVICGFPQPPDERLFNLLQGLPLNPGNPFLFFSTKPTEETLGFCKEKWGAFVHPLGVGLAGLINLKNLDLIQFETGKDFKKSFIPDLRKNEEKQFPAIQYQMLINWPTLIRVSTSFFDFVF